MSPKDKEKDKRERAAQSDGAPTENASDSSEAVPSASSAAPGESAPSPNTGNPAAPSDTINGIPPVERRPGDLCICAFDETTGAAITLPENTALTFESGQKTWTATISGKTKNGQHAVPDAPKLALPTLATLEGLSFNVNCTHYVSPDVSFWIPKESEGCCCIFLPVTPLEQTSNIRIYAYDTNSRDFIQNAKRFLRDVTVTVTALKSKSATVQNSSSHARSTWVGRSVNGEVRIDGVTQNTLLRMDIQGAPGYVCDTPILYRNLCCEPCIELSVCLYPCEDPLHRILFLQECGQPWASQPVEVGGQIQTTNADGSLQVEDANASIAWPDKSFTRVSTTSKISIVNVAAHPSARTSRPALPASVSSSRFYELDFEGELPNDVTVSAHTPDGEFIADVPRDPATDVFRFPVGQRNEQILFKAHRRGKLFDQALLTAEAD